MADPSWMQFTSQQPRRKRAELACTACHSKKIKCDLQARGGQGYSKCASCAAAGRECLLRPSKRDKQRQTARAQAVGPLSAPLNGGTSDQRTTSQPPREPIDVINVSQSSDHLEPNPLILGPEPADMLFQFETGMSGQPPNLNIVYSDPVAPNLGSLPQQEAKVFTVSPQASTVPQSQTDSHETEIIETMVSDVDMGFLRVFGPENSDDAKKQFTSASAGRGKGGIPEPLHPDLQQSFVETYFEYCYAWCPILDRSTVFHDLARSPLLSNALALLGSHIQPPMVPHEQPVRYYERARKLFYDNEEVDAMIALKGVSLFYWWAPRSLVMVHRDSAFWWTSVVIRHAQQMDMHREPGPHHPLWTSKISNSVRKRIWWTAFARERLTCICHSKPCIIDPEDCNISELELSDFPDNPSDQFKGEVFIYWVRVCAIIGRIAKHLTRSANKSSPSPFPAYLGHELIAWQRSLPPHLCLGVDSERTTDFNRDVHQLHLPYFTAITILHLKSGASQRLPVALPAAILAASYMARIFKDILNRGNARFLMAITCWYSAVASTALLQAACVNHLSEAALEELTIVSLTLKELRKMWPSANIIDRGVERLRATHATSTATATAAVERNDSCTVFDQPPRLNGVQGRSTSPDALPATSPFGGADSSTSDDGGIDWKDYFPSVTPNTSGIAQALLEGREQTEWADELFFSQDQAHDDSAMMQLEDFFGLLDDTQPHDFAFL